MTWVKLDDGFPDHDKVRGLSDAAFRSYVTALCFSARARLDGRVPAERVRQWVGTPKRVDELVAARLLDRDEAGELTIHDFLKFNPSKVQIDAEREAAKERMQRLRSPEHPSNGSPSPSRSDPDVLSEHPKKKKEEPALTDEDRRGFRSKWAPVASTDEVDDQIELALSYRDKHGKSLAQKYSRLDLAVGSWLRRAFGERTNDSTTRPRTGGGSVASGRTDARANGRGNVGGGGQGRNASGPAFDLPPGQNGGLQRPSNVSESYAGFRTA